MRSVLVAFCIMGLITEVAQASSIMTIEAPAQAISPSIIEVVAATPTSPASDEISLSPQGSLQLTQLDPLNMLPAGGSSVVRMEPITPSVIAVIAPTPDVSTEMVAAIEHRKPRVNDMPMVMRGGIVGDPFMSEIELGKALGKLPADTAGKQPPQTATSMDPEALNKPQFTESGAPMPANGSASTGRPRHSALTRSMRKTN